MIVNFNFPSSNGGSPIASYTATATPGQVTAKGVGSPITLKGLVNGQTYQVTLTATNKAGGTSSPSSSVAGVPATTPTAPTDVAATAGNVEATVTFTASSSDGGSAITGYTAISSPKGGADTNASTTSTSHLVTGLKNGTKYTFTVDATNGVGTTASKPSKPVTPATVPGQPTSVKATAGKTKGQLTVTFKPPASNGGSTILLYTVQSPQDGSIKVTHKSSPITVTGLMSGMDYQFTVFATNTEGDGQASNASSPVAAP